MHILPEKDKNFCLIENANIIRKLILKSKLLKKEHIHMKEVETIWAEKSNFDTERKNAYAS